MHGVVLEVQQVPAVPPRGKGLEVGNPACRAHQGAVGASPKGTGAGVPKGIGTRGKGARGVGVAFPAYSAFPADPASATDPAVWWDSVPFRWRSWLAAPACSRQAHRPLTLPSPSFASLRVPSRSFAVNLPLRVPSRLNPPVFIRVPSRSLVFIRAHHTSPIHSRLNLP